MTVIVAHAATNAKPNFLHRERARQNRVDVLVPLEALLLAVRQRERGADARREVSLPIQRGHDDERGVLHKIGVIEFRRGLLAAHQSDGLLQIAIPRQAKPGNFQLGVLDFVGFFAVSGVETEQQETGDE